MCRAERLILMIFLALACGLAVAEDKPADAKQAEDNPILGAWVWNPTEGSCREVHTYRPDGSKRSESGEEVLEKDYHIKRVREGLYLVSEIVLRGNDKPDCMGGTTPVAATASYYVLLNKGGGYYTCASEDGMSCYGSASRLPTEP